MYYVPPEFKRKYSTHFKVIYPDRVDECVNRLHTMIGRYGLGLSDVKPNYEWTQKDAILITYGDMVAKSDGDSPLQTLNEFLTNYVDDLLTTVHILPFFPYSSDDGFSVIDYAKVDEELGDWDDITDICSNQYRIMADVVMNHASRQSNWFRDFINDIAPGRNYFISVDPDTDLSDVVRPRSFPLLTPIQTKRGSKHVWTTFSDDQVDLNYSNPDVLFEFLDIIFQYISTGIRVLRLDAVAFIFKRIGTTCIHLPETHQIVKLMRALFEEIAPDVSIITETNVPHKENISYFGASDEAHMVYQFSLPPLILHAILSENASYITEWADALPDLPKGCMFFNFTASHDGIGVRPIEGLVPDEDLQLLVSETKKRDGFVSYKTNSDGSKSPYELNITYFDAFQDVENDNQSIQIKRFICSQIIMLGLRGVPGIYFQNLVGAKNARNLAQRTGIRRHINRKRWDYDKLTQVLDDKETHNYSVYQAFKRLLSIRQKEPAFHPDALQHVHNFGSNIFAFTRAAQDNQEAVLALCNICNKCISVPIADDDDKMPLLHNKSYTDLISGDDITVVDSLELKPYQCMWLKLE